MPNLLSALRRKDVEQRFTVSDYAAQLAYAGHQYPLIGGAGAWQESEQIENDFTGYVNGAYKRNGIVFASILARLMLFSEARFQFQRMTDGRPGDLFNGPELNLLEYPWPNGTTGELLSRMIQDADLAGNFYAVREQGRLRRLRPDWVTIILSAAPGAAVASDIVGYLYHPGGVGSSVEQTLFTVGDVVHWSPIPDPDAQYRGMSWLSPVVREISADKAATEHKLRFFENGATLSTVLTLGESVTEDQFKTWVRKFREAHQGSRNAYEPLFLGGGADAKVVGADLKQLDFKVTQGGGETRIAAASGVHPVILGLSEGLAGSSLNAGNFSAARRLTADKALRPLWRSACAALASVVQVPAGARLWYDDRDIAFLREDTKDLAEIQATQGQTIRTLVDAGYKPDSVKAAVIAQDWNELEHTGTFSVQLQPPGGADAPDGDAPKEPAPGGGEASGSAAAGKPAAVQKQRDVAETLQKVYLAVDKVITADEARAIANKAGATLPVPGPFQPADAPAEPDDVEPVTDELPVPDDELEADADPDEGAPDEQETQA